MKFSDRIEPDRNGQPAVRGILIATGIDADGRLEVRTGAGARSLGAGDVVHVRAAGAAGAGA